MTPTAALTTAPKAKRARKAKAEPVEIAAFKAFDANLACLGHQYEVGKTYTLTGKPAICDRGFHSCVDPLDVLNYYDITSSRFATVKAGGAISRHTDGDSKIASASITIVAELKLPDFIRAAVQATIAVCKAAKTKGSVTSGDSATNASSGLYAKNASSGHYAKNASSGHYAKNASSGDSATNASSGYYATNASSGHYAKNASSGDSATNASSGHYAKNAATGKHSVIAAAGRNSQAKGADGCFIMLPEYAVIDGEWRCIGGAMGFAGRDGIPADTWLIARDGKLVSA